MSSFLISWEGFLFSSWSLPWHCPKWDITYRFLNHAWEKDRSAQHLGKPQSSFREVPVHGGCRIWCFFIDKNVFNSNNSPGEVSLVLTTSICGKGHRSPLDHFSLKRLPFLDTPGKKSLIGRPIPWITKYLSIWILPCLERLGELLLDLC